MKNIQVEVNQTRAKAQTGLVNTTNYQSVHPLAGLTDIPGVDVLLATPGLEPYLTPDLIPDLITMAQKGIITEALSRANPDDPKSIIFNYPTQAIYQETRALEIKLATGQVEVIQSDVICINPKCRAKKVVGPFIKQTRRADEPPTAIYRCTQCKRQWHFSTA